MILELGRGFEARCELSLELLLEFDSHEAKSVLDAPVFITIKP